MTDDDFLKRLGVSALGTRLRRLLERLNGPVTQLYRDELGFEQRWFALLQLLGDRGEVRMGEAASALGVSHVAIVHSVTEMTRKGLVEKRADEADRRVSLIALSDAGQDVLSRVRTVSRRVDMAAKALLEEAAPDFMTSLDRLDTALEAKGFAARIEAARKTEKENQI
ncbi:MarR family transcriptional regulator [Henriciella sp. AS95]|uniref:MarR family winged helix-turn-helix transcriptional regulator n=1 Tax=Henriciella sp. AS95 TaxID=3135782 RepID=UPI003181A214